MKFVGSEDGNDEWTDSSKDGLLYGTIDGI